MKTLPLKGKNWRFWLLALTMVICWLGAGILVLMTGRWIGAWSVLLVVVMFIAIIAMHIRYKRRMIESLYLATPCHQCGRSPMGFREGVGSEHSFLICQHCKIEWDIGQI